MFIIKYSMLIMGERRTMYHKNIELNPIPDCTNVYAECLTDDKKWARAFHDKQEANKVVDFFLYTKNAARASIINR